ncbi:MAG: hypothetical protein CVV42_13275 [Candidatus Riflebacteria bacterium HGW-Riflebacteria-2]|nr:MAG: hypothetical protein CVV42_13275 [Candidatus Riflebacteria bacterium HGW-Riflebacteria-2]
MSGGGGSLGGGGSPYSSALLTGRVYFAERQLYGGIPVAAYDMSGEKIETVLTDANGYFAFSTLPAGVYNLAALTGESEVVFARSVQIDGVNLKEVNETSLLSIVEVVIDEISSSSFHLKFKANRASRASVEYGPLGGYQQTVTIGQAGFTSHEITITGLRALNDYEATIFLTGDDGQDFIMRGLYVGTTGSTGPTNLSVAINEGDYETKTQNVTLYLNADNCTHMRISESYEMAEASWVTYSQTYSYTIKSTTAGTKRVYVQFRDASGVTSPIQSDSILMSQNGYVGIWINDGEAMTSEVEALLKIVFPNATHMQLANSSDFLNTFWEVYVESKKWRFSSGDGMKTVYCRFKGGEADPNEVFTASIILDTTAPELEMKIDKGNKVTATTSVTITFDFSTPPSQMKLANTAAPASSAAWISFSDTVKWTIPTDDGEKEIFAIFRDGAGNEFGPISAVIELDTVAPTGNAISLLASEDTASGIATYALTASLPIFLHFDVADETTYQAHYTITSATTTPPVSSTTVGQPFTPVALDASVLPVGTNKIWTVFSDQAGNTGYYQTTNVKIDGPQIIVSPETATLKSGQTQQYAATLKNISSEEAGNIRWSVIGGTDASGTIDSNTGLFTAPSPVFQATTATVRAYSTLIPSLLTQVTANLTTSVEMLFLQRTGEFAYTEISDQVAPGDSITAQVLILHSNNGYEISKQPTAGSVSISSSVATTSGTVATLTYNAPATAPTTNPVLVGIRSIDSSSVVGTLTFLVSTGANLKVTPSTGDAQRNLPLNISATVTGTASTTMTWSISPTNMGSFAPESIITAATTENPDHVVTFYASSTAQIRQASVTAIIDGASKTCNITVYPPINFVIEPTATDSMPITAPMTFTIPGFDYLLGNASEAVIWEFKNTARADYMPADGKTYVDRGSLTVIDEVTAEYRRPSVLPSLSDPTAVDTVTIRATSVADSMASKTAVITIAEKVVVEIYDSVEKIASITTAATVAEVGKIQFFAGVTPSVIGDTSVNWTVNGVTTSKQYGDIDANGLYTAPDLIVVNEVTVRATSNYDSTAYAEVKVSLSDFWLTKRTNMFDSNTGEVIPVTAVMVNPYTASGSDFIVYAGTSGYGVWVATFSDLPGDTSGGYWQPITGLSVNTKNTDGRYHVNHLTISPDGRVYAATAGGVWYINDGGTFAKLNGANPADDLPNYNYLKLALDNKNPQYLFATTPRGVYRATLINFGTEIGNSGVLKVLNTTDIYKNDLLEARPNTASPAIPATIEAYTNIYEPNPINGILQTIAYDDFNDRLYAGGEGGVFLYMGDTSTPNMLLVTATAFTANEPSVATAAVSFYLLTINQPMMVTLGHPPLDLALDVINRNTLWAATVGGVYRSVDNGMTWGASAFGTGSNVNTRAIIVDPTNTINVLAGSEDGLYRTTDAGGNWTRIKSGLGNHKTITSLTQAAGLAGARRKVWVGTAGGVFMGKQSLDLE